MVVVLHVAAMTFGAFDEGWWASNFYDSFTRSCVPLFLMISGVLLLGKDETLPVFFKKRFVRVLPPLVFWSLFYMIWNTWQGKRYGQWWDWVRELASGPVTFHLWYLYAIVGIYLFVPFLRNIWHASRASEKRIYLAFWALASSWPTLQTAFGLDLDVLDTYGLGSFFGLAGYLFLGAYVREQYQARENKARYWAINLVLFLVFSVATMVATYLYSSVQGQADPLFYDYLSPFVLASSVCAFNVLYGAGTKVTAYSGPLQSVAACTLGVYCIHIFVMDRFEAVTGLSRMAAWTWWSIPLTAVAVFGVSLAAILLLRRFKAFQLVT